MINKQTACCKSRAEAAFLLLVTDFVDVAPGQITCTLDASRECLAIVGRFEVSLGLDFIDLDTGCRYNLFDVTV